MHVRDRIFISKVRFDQLRRRSRQLMQTSAILNRQAARLRALTPIGTVHLVKERFDDPVTLAGALSEGSRVFDRETSASIAD